MTKSKPVCGQVALIMHQMLRGTLSSVEAAGRLGVEHSRLAIYRRFVKQHCRTILEKNFAVLSQLVDGNRWDRLVDEYFVQYPFEDPELNANAAGFPHFLWEIKTQAGSDISEFHVELAELEWKEFVVYSALQEVPRPGFVADPLVNPTLVALECVYPVAEFIRAWRSSDVDSRPSIPASAEGLVFVYRHPQSEMVRAIQANTEMLLAVKVVHESMDIETTALEVGVTTEDLQGYIRGAIELGVICGYVFPR